MKSDGYDSDWFDSPDIVKCNGASIAVYRINGNEKLKSKKAIIFCHGFPEIAFSWRYQIGFFRDLGYTVIVPDLRGYGKSEAPESSNLYLQSIIERDICELMDFYHLYQAILIGHDFGGTICWGVAKHYPERVSALVVSSSPFPDYAYNPVEVCDVLYGENNYFRYFQSDDSVALLNTDIENTISFYMRRDVGYGTNLSVTRKKDAHTMSHPYRLEAVDEWVGEPILNTNELEFYKEMYERNGFSGPLMWYRCIESEYKRQQNTKTSQDKKICIPVLSIGSELDFVVPYDSCEKLDDYCENYSFIMLSGVGHWANQENASLYNSTVSHWLEKEQI